MRFPLRSFFPANSANFATMTALAAPIMIALAGFAVDEGYLYVERREAQSITDLAAIAAVGDIASAEEVARTTFADNGLLGSPDDILLTAIPGRYSSDPTLPVGQRFVAGATSPNAVKVDFGKTGGLFFARVLMSPPRIVTSAVASRQAEAAFSIGSRLARLDGGLLNALLGGLTGSELSLDAMDYDALLSAGVDLLGFFGALASKLDLEAATYAELLDTKLTFSQFAAVLSATQGASTRARSAATAIAGHTARTNAPRFKLSRLLGLDALAHVPVGASIGGLTVDINALEMLAAAAAVANGSQQVHLDLGASVPGLLDTALDLAIGEPPQDSAWFAIGTGGEIVRTAQTRLRLVLQVGGPGGTLGASIRLPLYLDLAYAEARLAKVSCPTGRPESIEVAVDARPGIADLRIADIDAANLSDFRNPVPLKPATLVSLPLITVTGTAHAEIGESAFTRLTFGAQDIEDETVKQVATDDFTQSLLASLLGDLELHVDVAGIGLGLPALLGQTVAASLQAATPAIDDLLSSLLSTLGVSLGEADIRVHGASCGRAVLVQ